MKLTDHYLVRLTDKYEDSFGNSGILRPKISERIADERDKETETGGMDCIYNPDLHLMKHGSVVSVPNRLSKIPLHPVYEGLPCPQPYVSGDACEKFNLGRRGYEPSTHEHRFHTAESLFKIEPDATEIWFYHDSIDHNNPILDDTYQVHVKDVFAFRDQDGVIYACQGFVVARKIKVKTFKSTLILFGMENEKEQKNTLSAIFIPKEGDINVFDDFIHAKNADYPVTMEGEDVFAVRESDVLCILSNESHE